MTTTGRAPELLTQTSSPLQEQISLSAPGNMVTVGAPGGPVVFAAHRQPILTCLAGRFPRNIVSGAIHGANSNQPA